MWLDQTLLEIWNLGMVMKLTRCQLRQQGKNPDWVYWNVTVKTARIEHQCMAPTWTMVNAIKKRATSEDIYTTMYRAILNGNKDQILIQIKKEIEKGTQVLAFVCYCPDNTFCHTYLLIDWLLEQMPELQRLE